MLAHRLRYSLLPAQSPLAVHILIPLIQVSRTCLRRSQDLKYTSLSGQVAPSRLPSHMHIALKSLTRLSPVSFSPLFFVHRAFSYCAMQILTVSAPRTSLTARWQPRFIVNSSSLLSSFDAGYFH